MSRVMLISVRASAWKCISGGCNSCFFRFVEGMSAGDADVRHVFIMSLSI